MRSEVRGEVVLGGVFSNAWRARVMRQTCHREGINDMRVRAAVACAEVCAAAPQKRVFGTAYIA